MQTLGTGIEHVAPRKLLWPNQGQHPANAQVLPRFHVFGPLWRKRVANRLPPSDRSPTRSGETFPPGHPTTRDVGLGRSFGELWERSSPKRAVANRRIYSAELRGPDARVPGPRKRPRWQGVAVPIARRRGDAGRALSIVPFSAGSPSHQRRIWPRNPPPTPHVDGRPGATARPTPHPCHGKRIGEAAHTGPPSGTDAEAHGSTSRKGPACARPNAVAPIARLAARATHRRTSMLLNWCRIRSAQVPAAHTCAMAPQATEEATPSFTPPATPVADEGGACTPNITPPSAIAPLPWQDGCPPSSALGERNSRLYVPLLHAAAGNLSARALQAWRAHPVLGPRFEELATTWRMAKPTMPGGASQQMMRLRQRRWPGCLTCLCHCKRPKKRTTMLACMGPDGYLSAAAQSALIESCARALVLQNRERPSREPS